jgi:hypothetical protein
MGHIEDLVEYFTNRDGRKKRKRVLITPIQPITQEEVQSSVKEEKPTKTCHNKTGIGRKRTSKKSSYRLLKRWRK